MKGFRASILVLIFLVVTFLSVKYYINLAVLEIRFYLIIVQFNQYQHASPLTLSKILNNIVNTFNSKYGTGWRNKWKIGLSTIFFLFTTESCDVD